MPEKSAPVKHFEVILPNLNLTFSACGPLWWTNPLYITWSSHSAPKKKKTKKKKKKNKNKKKTKKKKKNKKQKKNKKNNKKKKKTKKKKKKTKHTHTHTHTHTKHRVDIIGRIDLFWIAGGYCLLLFHC